MLVQSFRDNARYYRSQLINGRCYESFSIFKSTCEAFFTTPAAYKAELCTYVHLLAPECQNFIYDKYITLNQRERKIDS